MERICPNCGEQLHSSCVYFCSYCGKALPDNLVLSSEVFVPSILNPFSDKKHIRSILEYFDREKLRSLLFLFSLTVMVFIAIWLVNVGVDYVDDYERKLAVGSNEVAKKYANTVDLKLDMPRMNFDTFLLSGVPYDATALIIGSNISFVSGFFGVSDEIKAELSENYEPFYTTYFIKKSDNVSIGILVKVKPNTIATKIDGWYSDIIADNVVIFTNDESLISMTRDSLTKVTRSILQNPEFSSAKPLLKPSGQLLVINFSKDFNLFYEVARQNNVSPKLLEYIDQLGYFKYDKFVVDKHDTE